MSGYALAIVIFLIASFTDILDGHIARKRNQVSTLGKFFDPIADKLLVSAALIVLVEKHLAPSWAVVIILGREFIVTGLRSVAAAEGIIIQAKNSGKLKMWAQCVAIVALLVAAAAGPPPVSNFGLEYPAFRFWEVGEVQTAFSHLSTLEPDNRGLAGLRLPGRTRSTVGRGRSRMLVDVRVFVVFLSRAK